MIHRFTGTAARGFAVAVPSLFVAACAQAQPGHGLLDHGAGHAFSSPYHAGVLAAIGVGCWIAGRFVARRALPRRLLGWAGATALLAAAALWTFGL